MSFFNQYVHMILPEIFFSFPIDDTEIVVQSQGVFQSDFEYELFEC